MKGMYRKVDFDIWTDPKFRELSDPPPCGKYLWLYLLVGKHTTIIPGVTIASPAEVCAALGWATPEFLYLGADLFDQLEDAGMIETDAVAGLIWLPNALKRNLPSSPNHVRQWKGTWERVPQCVIKAKIWGSYQGILEDYRQGYGKTFVEGCPEVDLTNTSQPVEKVSCQGYGKTVNSKQLTGSSTTVPVVSSPGVTPVAPGHEISLVDDPFGPPSPAPTPPPVAAPVTPEPAPPPAPAPPPTPAPQAAATAPPQDPSKPTPYVPSSEDEEAGDVSPHKAFIDVFNRTFEKHRGVEPAWGKKEGAMVKKVLERTKGDLTLALQRVKRMFQLAPAWPAENPDLATLVGHWDKFAPPPRGGSVGGQQASATQHYGDGEVKL